MYTQKRLWLKKDPEAFKKWQELMLAANLSPNATVEYTVGIFDGEELIASGSFEKNIIKCIAVKKTHRSENLLPQLMTQLMRELRERKWQHFFVYTKPDNREIFSSLGFIEVIATNQVLLLEQGSPLFSDYRKLLLKKKKAGPASGIVMNADPFTKGHLHLIETAAKQSKQVYVFVLSEDCSTFSAADRMAMVKLGCEHLRNVTILPTNDYLVSSATFPNYFLKERARLEVARTQAVLDATLFKEKIAPLLEINTRFVGEEPFSEVTEVYNQSMKAVFDSEITLVILPRIAASGKVISATKVREAIKKNDEKTLHEFLPNTTYDYLNIHNKL